MPQEQKQKKKRVPITALTKQEICIKKRENLKLRDEDLAKEYGLDRSTITKILKQKDKWLAIDPNSNYAKQKTQKSPKFPQIEDSLASWVSASMSSGNVVSDAQLQEKALELAQLFGIRNEFQASNGWISKFKNRHQVRSGDGPGAPELSLQQFRHGYPELSPHLNSRYLEQFKTTGRLIEGTKGAEFIDGMIPRENDIVIKRRRADAFYNTDLQMILESRNIRHIILSGIATSDVILPTILTAFNRDMTITVVSDCCFDVNEPVQKMLTDEFFPKQNVMVVRLDDILKGL
ncbi:10959_t:CDS:2 [Acaulospora colombiana]|uniref:10959_t:CDS:1 n=1 Tax=Acaulospora colombiana TaxID=27376 RepID=A0ACA9N026_9GLOM|nr:10959_t:CDS:2 [Acaulospora colombiana]